MELVPVTDLGAVREAAARVTRHLPEAHGLTRGWRETRFKEAVGRFIDLLRALDVSRLEPSDFNTVEALISMSIKAIEIHLLATSPILAAADPVFCEAIERLRVAAYGISRGYPADPRLQPSRADVKERGVKRLTQMYTDGNLVTK